MANSALSRLERIYLQKEANFGVIPNTGGTATLAGGDACRHIKCTMNPTVDTLTRPDKTGSRSRTAGSPGRRIANWSLSMSLAPSGVAGTPPDCDPILQSLFWSAGAVQSGTVNVIGATNATPIVIETATAHGLADRACVTLSAVGGNTAANGTWLIEAVDATHFSLRGSVGNGAYTSGGVVSKAAVKYVFADDPAITFALWRFRQPSTIMQQVALGCIVNRATFNLGQDIAQWESEGAAKWVLDSKTFSSMDAEAKGGLSAFPSEPGSPVTAGTAIPGFTGRAVINGTSYAKIRNARVQVQTGGEIPREYFSTYYGQTPEADEREVLVDYVFDDEDTATADLLHLAAITKDPIDLILQIGTIPGSIFVLDCQGVQSPVPGLNDESRLWTRGVQGAQANGTSLTAKDELVAWVA